MPLEYDFVLTNVLSRILQNDKLLCVHFILISKSTDDQGILKTKSVIPREEGELILPNSCFCLSTESCQPLANQSENPVENIDTTAVCVDRTPG